MYVCVYIPESYLRGSGAIVMASCGQEMKNLMWIRATRVTHKRSASTVGILLREVAVAVRGRSESRGSSGSTLFHLLSLQACLQR